MIRHCRIQFVKIPLERILFPFFSGMNSRATKSVMPMALMFDIQRMSKSSAAGTTDFVAQGFNFGEMRSLIAQGLTHLSLHQILK